MAWIAISDHEGQVFSFNGLGAPSGAPQIVGSHPGAMLVRGSLVIETRLPTSLRPKPLVFFKRDGACPFHVSLQAVPGGGLTLVLDQGGEVLHRTINHSDAGRTDVLRVTYSWDAPARWGQLALERTDQDTVLLVPVTAPKPMWVADARALVTPGGDSYFAPDVLYLALSTDIEPVGPNPSLMSDTPVATPTGYRAVGGLCRGDLVLTADGHTVPVLHSVSRVVPAKGSFSPVRLRAPYFGLKQDISVASTQRIVLSGSEVEYLFGRESVLVPVGHLVGGTSVLPLAGAATVRYTQLLLPGHETLIAAGTSVESLYIGRLSRKKQRLAASLLAKLDRLTLPDHGSSMFPVLKAFDARVLADHRAA
jgi:Hint domain